jgi:hypothetical protein
VVTGGESAARAGAMVGGGASATFVEQAVPATTNAATTAL